MESDQIWACEIMGFVRFQMEVKIGLVLCLDTGEHSSVEFKLLKCHFRRKTEISQYKLHSDKSQNNVIVGPYDSP